MIHSTIQCDDGLYLKFRPMLNSMAGSFSRRYGGDVLEIQSEVSEYFLYACKDWDGERDFKTWVKFVVWKTLLEKARRKAVRNATLRQTYLEMDFIKSKSKFSLRKLSSELSIDANTLIELALNPPREGKETPSQRRGSIISFLFKMGWEKARIIKAIKEVREALV